LTFRDINFGENSFFVNTVCPISCCYLSAPFLLQYSLTISADTTVRASLNQPRNNYDNHAQLWETFGVKRALCADSFALRV